MEEEIKNPEEMPNRSRYAAMFSEDNPDVDFEDKEARYGRLADERELYRGLKKSGKGLSEALDKNRWLGAMFQDLAENPDKDPVSWMYDNGIDVQKAMEDEEYRKKVSESLVRFQENQVKGEQSAEQRDKNLEKSASVLDELSRERGLSDEQCDRMWNHIFKDVIAPGMEGEVSKETWDLVLRAMNYDQDISNAREEAGMQARNEKIQNKLKNYDESQVPPSFSQGQGKPVSSRSPRKRESLMDFVRKNS